MKKQISILKIMGWIDHGDEDFSLVEGFDDGPFIAAGGFANHMWQGQLGQFFD